MHDSTLKTWKRVRHVVLDLVAAIGLTLAFALCVGLLHSWNIILGRL